MFAAAEAVRFIEYGLQSYANILLGLAVIFLGAATAVGGTYPRWLGGLAIGSGVAWIVHGVMVTYVGLFDSTPRLVGMALLVIWGLTMAALMWRNTGQRTGGQRPATASTSTTVSV